MKNTGLSQSRDNKQPTPHHVSCPLAILLWLGLGLPQNSPLRLPWNTPFFLSLSSCVWIVLPLSQGVQRRISVRGSIFVALTKNLPMQRQIPASWWILALSAQSWWITWVLNVQRDHFSPNWSTKAAHLICEDPDPQEGLDFGAETVLFTWPQYSFILLFSPTFNNPNCPSILLSWYSVQGCQLYSLHPLMVLLLR